MMSAGDPFFGKRFSEKDVRSIDLHARNVVLYLTATKKAPVHRGLFGGGIVPTGELEGRQDPLILL